MKTLLRVGVTLGLLIGLVSVAEAQGQGQGQRRPGGGGMGGGMSQTMLLGQKSVQEELKMTEDQVKAITAYSEKSRGAFRDLQGLSREEIAKKMEEAQKEGEKVVSDTLKPEQVKRLKEIAFQQRQRGGMAALLADKTIADQLKLTADQQDLLKALADDGRKFREELGIGRGGAGGGGGGGGGFGLSEEQRKKMEDFRKGQDEKINKALTDEQKAKIKELAGAEFKGEIRFGGGRPGGAGGNRQGGGR